MQIGVTLSGFLSASFGASSLAPYIIPVVQGWGVPSVVANPLVTVVLTLVISYCSIVISEMVPKRIAMQKAEQISRAVVPAIDAFAKVCKPIIWLIGKNTNGHRPPARLRPERDGKRGLRRGAARARQHQHQPEQGRAHHPG